MTDENRIATVERQVSALEAKQQATDARLDRLQEAVAEARASAHRDSENLRGDIAKISDKLDGYAQESERWRGGKQVAIWGFGSIATVLGIVLAWIKVQ